MKPKNGTLAAYTQSKDATLQILDQTKAKPNQLKAKDQKKEAKVLLTVLKTNSCDCLREQLVYKPHSVADSILTNCSS